MKWFASIFLVASLTGLALFVFLKPGTTPSAAPAATTLTADVPNLEEEPDLRLGGATITEFSATGAVRYRLDAEAMARYENHDETLVGSPSLRIQPESPGASPWHVVSNDGAIRQVMREDGTAETMVLLRREVVLRQLHQETDRSILTIRSEAIDLFPERQFAKSVTDVMIDSDVGRTQAIGMEGDLKSGKLLLSSEPEQPVHTIVLPAQFKKQSA